MLKIPAGLLDATRLVRGGKLLAATQSIQRTLRGAEPASTAEPHDDSVIEGTYRVVNAPAPACARAPSEAPRPKVDAPDPRAPGRFVTRTYANAAGAREYKVFVPAAASTQPLPVVVMLHGCTQDPDDFASGTRMNALAEEHGFVVVYPKQAPQANVSKCWNWFEAKDQQRDAGEPSIIAGITREVVAEYGADATRVYVAGLSAGGAMAVIMGTTYPDVYAAVGIHSGLAYAAANDVSSAFAAMRGQKARLAKRRARPNASARTVPMILFHGDNDTTVHPSNGEELMAQASRAAGAASNDKTFAAYAQQSERGDAGGRTYTRVSARDGTSKTVLEHWVVHGAAHAWFGGSADGSYTDPHGPDASREMVRFFLQHQSR